MVALQVAQKSCLYYMYLALSLAKIYLNKCNRFSVKIQCVKGCACSSSIIDVNHSCFFLRAASNQRDRVTRNSLVKRDSPWMLSKTFLTIYKGLVHETHMGMKDVHTFGDAHVVTQDLKHQARHQGCRHARPGTYKL